MAKLNDIPHGKYFNTPDGYFDQLPLRIMARLEKKTGYSSLTPQTIALWFVAPMIVIAAAVVFYLTRDTAAEKILADVPAEHLMEYLLEDTRTYEDPLESVDLSADELRTIENQIYSEGLLEIDSLWVDI